MIHRQPNPTHRPRLAWLVHSLRVAVVVGLLLAIPSPASQSDRDSGSPPDIGDVRPILPGAATIDPIPDANNMWVARDIEGNKIAAVARTLPIAEDVVGFRGPTQSLIAFDDDLIIRGVRLLDSADTAEHVQIVSGNADFFGQFNGWPWGGPARNSSVDAVSGATLTSLALVEGVLKRIGGDRPSLVFSDSLTVQEVRDLGGEPNQLIRTGPLTDDIIGYQGPTELLLSVSPDRRVDRIRMQHSYDNQPYVDYVRTEAGFWALFEQRTISELAQLDPESEGIEGVSGATMTSLAVADTVVAAAGELESQFAEPVESTSRSSGFRWTIIDLATIALLLALAAISHLGWFRNQTLRRGWLQIVLIVIGFWAGNMVSMALVAGWAAEGIAWRLAPGLSAVAAVAMICPPLTKGNPYCNHLCPHGAIQQLIRPGGKDKRHLRLPRKLSRVLTWIPGITLVVAYVTLLMTSTIDLSSWEPFHAYLFRIAGWGSIALAVASLAVAAWIPMGYCRLGCPTGRLLSHLRRSASSHKIVLADGVALGLLVLAIAIRS